MCKTDICTDSPDKDSSTGESTSTSARSSNYDGEQCEEADDDKAMQAKTPEGLQKKAEKHKAGKKQAEAGPNRRKMGKQKKSDKRESLIELLQGQQEMMVIAEE